MKHPQVSVLLPVFNAERFLRQSIESILEQSYPHLELLILEDGSTDRSLEIIHSFDDARIQVHRSVKNQGVVYQLNKGLQLAKGQYIARMDADDVAMPNRLEWQVSFLEEHPDYMLVGSWAKVIDEQGFIQQSAMHTPKDAEEIQLRLLFKTPFIHPTVCFRANLAANFKYEPSFFPAEDYHLWTKVAAQHRVANIENYLLYYRLHTSNVHRTHRQDVVDTLQQIIRPQLDRIGIPYTSAQLQTHQRVAARMYFKDVVDKMEVHQVQAWLAYLKNWNEQKGIWQSECVERQLSEIWWEYCLVAVQRIDYGTLRHLLFNPTSGQLSLAKRRHLLLRFFRRNIIIEKIVQRLKPLLRKTL